MGVNFFNCYKFLNDNFSYIPSSTKALIVSVFNRCGETFSPSWNSWNWIQKSSMTRHVDTGLLKDKQQKLETQKKLIQEFLIQPLNRQNCLKSSKIKNIFFYFYYHKYKKIFLLKKLRRATEFKLTRVLKIEK